MRENIRRISLDQARKLRSLSNERKFQGTSEADIDRMIAENPDLYQLTDEELAQFKLVRNEGNENDNGRTRMTSDGR